MLPQPPCAYSACSDMTLSWCRSTKLDRPVREEPAPGVSAKRKHIFLPQTPSTPLSLTATTLLNRSRKSRFRNFGSNAIYQVIKLPGRCVLTLLVLLALLSQPATSKPWSSMQPDHVVFNTRICQPVPPTILQSQISPYLSNNRMASGSAFLKRNTGSAVEDSGNAGYQGDEPGADLPQPDDVDFIDDAQEWNPNDDLWMAAREEDIYTGNNRMVKEIEEDEVWERHRTVPRQKIPAKRGPNRVGKTGNRRSYRKNPDTPAGGYSSQIEGGNEQTIFSDSYSYMKRRRRRSLEDTESLSQSTGGNPSVEETFDENVNFDENVDFEDLEEDEGENDSKDKKSTDSIPLKLYLKGKNKKTRKVLKKKLRQKVKNENKPPPWECKFAQGNRRMQRGIFPDILLDGRCETDKCFYRLYNCDPIKYAVKLLQRDPEKCNPLPSVSNITVYEERWNLISYHVTVGCSCSSPNIKNSKPKSRRRD